MEKLFFFFTIRVFGGRFPYFDAIAKLYNPYRIREYVVRQTVRLVLEAKDARSAKVIIGALDFRKTLDGLGIVFLPGLTLDPIVSHFY